MPDVTTERRRSKWRAYAEVRLHQLGESAAFATLMIVLYQAKVMSGVLVYGDLALGDTASYFRGSMRWTENLQVHIAWSPLYTATIGSIQWLTHDAFTTLVSLRLSIAILGTVLVLTTLRRLLPLPLAWCLAAWWASLPIVFDTVYTVHLFASLFPLAVFATVAYLPGRTGRGLALGLLVVTTFLVRNEYALATLLWAGAAAALERRERSEGRGATWPRVLAAYGLPTVVAAMAVAFFYVESEPRYPELGADLRRKHTLNICQIYAFNRNQQGDAWGGNPWTECHWIMERDFGAREPTLLEAFRRNPGAILGHFFWNLQRSPSGIQLALFDRYWTGSNPDYVRAHKTRWVLVPTILLLALLAVGLRRVWRERELWWNERLRDTVAVWLAMLCTVPVTLIVMVVQRPRPSYMFPLTFFLMAVSGFCCHTVLGRPALVRAASRLLPLVAVLAVLLAPSHYSADYVSVWGHQGQKFKNVFDHARRHIDVSSRDAETVVVTSGLYRYLCLYLGPGCTGLVFETSVASRADGIGYAEHFAREAADWIYLDPTLLEAPDSLDVRDALVDGGWFIAGGGSDSHGPWLLLASPAREKARRNNVP